MSSRLEFYSTDSKSVMVL